MEVPRGGREGQGLSWDSDGLRPSPRSHRLLQMLSDQFMCPPTQSDEFFGVLLRQRFTKMTFGESFGRKRRLYRGKGSSF